MATSSSFTSRFPEAKFRDAIRNTMRMGMPEDEDQQLHWWWARNRTYSPQDMAGNPYSWDEPAATDEPGNPDLPDDGKDQSIIVDYVLEFSARPSGSTTTVLGDIDNAQAKITLFDVDYETIKTADYATIGAIRYRIQYVEPAQGLFGVTMYSVLLEAIDEARP